MELITQRFETPNGPVEGIHVKWPGFSILWVAGKKGFLACPAFDIEACNRYGVAAALIQSGPDNPIGTLDRFCGRAITSVNAKAAELGITKGMIAKDAFALIV